MLCLSGFELYFRCVPLFAWEIVRDSPMVNFVSRALVIGGEVYVA